MITRIRKSMQEKDKGFTLIELLVVMIIIGILAAIAIPIFLNQRKKANDTAATSDVSTIGKEIATYYVDATTELSTTSGTTTGVYLDTAGLRYSINGGDIGKASSNVSSVALSYSGVPTSGATVQDYSQDWCVQVGYSGGTRSLVKYSAKNGLVADGTGCP